MLKKYKYHTLLHLIIFMWGFTGILGVLINLDAFYIVWHRVLIAFLALGIALVFMKKSVAISSRKELLKIFGVGVIVALHWMTFYTSIQLSTACWHYCCLALDDFLHFYSTLHGFFGNTLPFNYNFTRNVVGALVHEAKVF